MHPSVAAVIPAYDAVGTIARAIQSVQKQSVPVDEIIVVDDGSADDTAAVAGSFPRVTVIRRPNGGPGAARNTGIRAAKSEWIAFLDADDAWVAEKNETQLKHVADGVGVIHSNAFNYVSFATLWNRRAHITPSGMMIRKVALEEIGGFEESRCVMSVEDLNLCMRLALTPWRFVASPVGLFRYLGTDGISTNDAKMARAELANIDMIGRLAGRDQAEIDALKVSVRVEYGRNLIATRKWDEAATILKDIRGIRAGWFRLALRMRAPRLARRELLGWQHVLGSLRKKR
jgi:glycosyltransferase involved in cell wall biosynthesis